jgi:hydrogenase maturation protein HypF
VELVAETARVSRLAIRVHGTVQGVGFRPTVYRIACASRLVGFVRNDSRGVLIEIEGAPDAVAAFPGMLRREAPPLARIESIEICEAAPRGDHEFRVVESMDAVETDGGATTAAIPSDTATCDACVRELFDPRDRRYRYPFINCTDCGPRYTIIRDVPYDRARTTMDAFPMCEACRAEYENPADRRFHAEPIACATCGPRVELFPPGTRQGEHGADVFAQATALLARGAILAVKGLGGYQLTVDARNEDAVLRLRARKRRPHKPFAVMARDLAALEGVVVLDAAVKKALLAPARPIVLAPRADRGERGGIARVAASVAPALHELGVMLPTTPLHHLLFGDARSGSPLLVMTSGNLTEEPIAKDEDEAIENLSEVADAFLVHDRPIHTRADDSVGRVSLGELQPVRRGRGWAPDPVSLPFAGPPVLAVGAELKNTVCLTRGKDAFVSQHVGDLGNYASRAFFEESIAKLMRLLGVAPNVVAHDLHPDYASTSWALASGLRAIAVQHHHAHVASCLVDSGATEGTRAIGVAFDGTGCGPAGDLWGGEILAFDLGGFVRVGHLRPIALAGGEAAIREPWRLALAALVDAGEATSVISDDRRDSVLSMIAKKVATPYATGAGRWFDAVAALLGVRATITYEAQAAAELEALAALAYGGSRDVPYPFALEPHSSPFTIDLRPTIRAIALDLRRGEPAADIASRFHSTMAEVVLASCVAARRVTGLDLVALSGGCFQNVIFTERTTLRLESSGFRVLVHRQVPPNDGGISLGQAAVAAYRLRNPPQRK